MSCGVGSGTCLVRVSSVLLILICLLFCFLPHRCAHKIAHCLLLWLFSFVGPHLNLIQRGSVVDSDLSSCRRGGLASTPMSAPPCPLSFVHVCSLRLPVVRASVALHPLFQAFLVSLQVELPSALRGPLALVPACLPFPSLAHVRLPSTSSRAAHVGSAATSFSSLARMDFAVSSFLSFAHVRPSATSLKFFEAGSRQPR